MDDQSPITVTFTPEGGTFALLLDPDVAARLDVEDGKTYGVAAAAGEIVLVDLERISKAVSE